jgi:UDP-N-acetyl-D-mannosaminuronic acid dehydrogenase
VENDRVIGGMTEACTKAATTLYKIFVKGECIATNARTAEMCKLTENSFRDVNIAFANELSIICDTLGIDVWELISLANRHPRVNILQPGPGVGGHCIAVDPWFIVNSDPDNSKIIKLSRNVNDSKPDFILRKIMQSIKKEQAHTVVCFGAAFKPDIDDLRESPAVLIIEKLAKNHKLKILVVEPNIDELPSRLAEYRNIKLCDLEFAIDHAQVGVLLVAHKQFKNISRLVEKKMAYVTAVKI